MSLSAVHYPEIAPFRTGFLRVSEPRTLGSAGDGRAETQEHPGHEIYFEESGNPQGKPVIFVHGGPGGGTTPKQRRFFDPSVYRIVLFDQRGCGQSTPHASLVANTTWDLVADMEKLREHLSIEKWQVFGGSWGSTLALAYAETHPSRVTELVLRGIFLLRPEELRFFYQEGSSWLFPDAFDDYVKPIPPSERSDLIHAFYKRLTSNDAAIRSEAARAWSVWEGRTSCLLPNHDLIARMDGDHFAEAFARIECHYFVNGGFFETPDQLLKNIDTIRHIPTVIVQGRYDVVCPAKSAWDLHKAFPEAEFHIVDDAGHSADEPGISARLIAATDAFRSRV